MRRRAYVTAVVGQCSLLREGIAHLLCAAESKFRIAAAAPSIYDPLLEPIEQHQLLLLIMDSGTTARALAEQILAFRDRQPAGRVAVISDQYVLPWIVSAFRAGANAYFPKIVTSEAFIKALELVMLGETILPSELLSCVPTTADPTEDPPDVRRIELLPDQELCIAPSKLLKLSSREECILRCIAEGNANKLIARKMGIADATVKVHVKAIFRKIGVQNRTQAAVWAKESFERLDALASTEDKDEVSR
jgi:two-component system, NarL family, nitrate/nitrite response regulator NarL